MPGLEESVGIDFSAALTDADEFATTVTDLLSTAVDTFSSSFETALGALQDQLAGGGDIAITADTSSIPAEIDAAVAGSSGEVPVDADTTAATTAVSDLVGAIDADAATITVDADTTAAQAGLDELSGSADSAGTSLSGASEGAHGLTVNSGALAGAAGLAVGEVSGLKEASSLLGERTAAATGGVLGLGVGLGELYHQGLQAVSAEERFNAALGDQAEAVQKINVGSLSADLGDLGVKFGSADAAIKNATTSVFQFAVNSGASREEATQFAQEIAAISARAVATKPSVGDIADVMDRAAIGIGRARTAASLLNVGLSTTEVNTRAAAIAQQNGEDSASAYDKSLAALQITVERFGPSLKQNVEEGAKNAANQAKAAKAEFDNALESFGKPLVAPGLDLIKTAIPVAEDFGKALSAVASVALPVLTAALDVLGPAIEPVVIGLLAVKGIQLGASLATEVLQLASAWGILGQEAATSAAEQGAAIYSTEVSLGTLSSAAIPGAIVGFAAFEGTTAILHAVFDSVDRIGPALKAEEEAAKQATGGTSASFDNLLKKVEETRIQAGASLTVAETAVGPFKRAYDEAASSTESLLVHIQAFRDLAELSLPAAAALASNTDKNTDAGRAYANILEELAPKQHDAKAATDDLSSSTSGLKLLNEQAVTSLAGYHDGTVTASQALKDLTASQQEENDALSIYKSNLEGIQAIQGDVTAANIAFGNATEHLNESLFKNGANFDLNTQAGRDNTSALQAQVKAADDLAEATFKQTGSQDAANNVMAVFKAKLDESLYGMGLNEQQVHDLETALGLLQAPPPITPTVDTGPALQAIADIDGALHALNTTAGQILAGGGNPAAAYGPDPAVAAYLQSQNYLAVQAYLHSLSGHSAGGFIDGPSGAGDVVPSLLSPGEFVMSNAMLAGTAAIPGRVLDVIDQAKSRIPSLVGAGGGGGGTTAAAQAGHTFNSYIDARGNDADTIATKNVKRQRAMQLLAGR